MCNQTLKNLPEGKGVLIPLKKFLVPKFHRDEGARSGELIRSRYNVYNEPENLSSSQQVERTQLIRVSTKIKFICKKWYFGLGLLMLLNTSFFHRNFS